jgi:hypothetical protein
MELQDGKIIPLKLVDIEANDQRDFNLNEAEIEGGSGGLRIPSSNIKSPNLYS